MNTATFIYAITSRQIERKILRPLEIQKAWSVFLVAARIGEKYLGPQLRRVYRNIVPMVRHLRRE